MFKYLSLTLFFIAALSFSSCNNDKENTDGEGTDVDTTATTTTDPNTTNNQNQSSSTITYSPDFFKAIGSLNGIILQRDGLSADKFNKAVFVSAMQTTLDGQAAMDPMQAQTLVQQEMKKAKEAPGTANFNDEFWKALGTLVVKSIEMQRIDLSQLKVNELVENFQSGLQGNPQFDEETATNIYKAEMQKIQQLEMQKQMQQGAAQAAPNIEAGRKFLAENAKKPGITVLPSGVQYKVLKKGTGPKPTANNQVKVHYHGTLIDGTVFDSSVDRGQPATFGVTQVIPGWVEILQMMPVGSKWKVFIPSDKAYGNMGKGNIGPGSTLIFEVELLEIVG